MRETKVKCKLKVIVTQKSQHANYTPLMFFTD